MAQKQKLKSERSSGNEALMDLFLTLDPQSFASVAKRLSNLFDADKKSFNLLLDKFDGLKGSPMEGSVDEHRTKKFISKPTVTMGDVNSDGVVNITDVTLLISYVLNNSGDINLANADCDGNDEISITDVTLLISYVLSGSWPD